MDGALGVSSPTVRIAHHFDGRLPNLRSLGLCPSEEPSHGRRFALLRDQRGSSRISALLSASSRPTDDDAG